MGLSTGSLSFQDSNLSDNSTIIYYTGQGIVNFKFAQTDPYCDTFSGKTYTGYYYDSISSQYF